jgi:hypothetical protein
VSVAVGDSANCIVTRPYIQDILKNVIEAFGETFRPIVGCRQAFRAHQVSAWKKDTPTSSDGLRDWRTMETGAEICTSFYGSYFIFEGDGDGETFFKSGSITS